MFPVFPFNLGRRKEKMGRRSNKAEKHFAALLSLGMAMDSAHGRGQSKHFPSPL